MGSRLISISFDKIYGVLKLCSLNGIFVASPSPLYLRVCILLAVWECVCVSVCGTTRVHVRQHLQLPWRQFAVGQREEQQAQHPSSHPSMPQLPQTKSNLCLHFGFGAGSRGIVRLLQQPLLSASMWQRVQKAREGSLAAANVHLIWICIYCSSHSKWTALLHSVGHWRKPQIHSAKSCS